MPRSSVFIALDIGIVEYGVTGLLMTSQGLPERLAVRLCRTVISMAYNQTTSLRELGKHRLFWIFEFAAVPPNHSSEVR